MHQTVFFSKIAYAEALVGTSTIKVNNLKEYEVLLVTGIAKTTPLCEFLKRKNVSFEHLKYPDHYQFTDKDLSKINTAFKDIKASKKLILTTEKDYVRTFDTQMNNEDVYYLPIQTAFLQHKKDFNILIEKYVELHFENV